MDQHMQDAPADVLADARRTLEALKSSGLSREVLLEMWEAGDRTSTSSGDTIMDDSSARTATSTALSSPSTPVSAFPPPPPPGAMHPQFGHRPRISVSSTSSGSSGHASIWSMGSMNSGASVSTHYSQSCMNPSSQNSQGVPAHTIGVPGNMTQVASAQTGWGPGRFNYYWCTSCETRFKRKYDWKRHEEEFHERWKKYPCPEPGCNRSFWGANTFNQHHKSSHGCKTCPHSEKVVKYLKRRKYWACGFCSALHPSRERHVEHVARHFESGKTKTDWMHSRVIYGLLHQPQIHEAWKDILMSKAAEFAGRQPNFSWNPTQTGRAQGFMENECPGQLQDLLEFFSGPNSEAESIVSVAYELADLVFLNVPASPPMDYAQGGYPPQPNMAPPPPPQQMQQQQPQQQHQQQQHQQQHQQHQQQQQQQQPQQQQQHQQPQQQQTQSYPPQPLLPPPAVPSQTIPTQQPTTPIVPSQQESSPQSYVESLSAQHSPMEMDHIARQQHMNPHQHQLEQQMDQHHLMPPPIFHQQAQHRASSESLMTRSSLDRDLPPPPQEAPPMNFNYMPTAPMVFESWDSFGNTVVEEQAPTQTPVSTTWPMMPVQYHYAPVGQQ